MRRSLYLCFLFATLACQTQAVEVDNNKDKLFELLLSYSLPSDTRYAQGLDILNGNVFQAFSDGTIDIYELSSRSLLQTVGPFKNEKGKILHMNDITFRTDNKDTLLIIPNNVVNTPLSVYRIHNNNGGYDIEDALLIGVPQIDISLYRATTQYYGNNNTCLQVAYERTTDDGYGDVIIAAYEFDSLSSDILYLNKWTRKYSRLWAMQGAWLDDDYCYLAVGVGNGDAKLYQISLNDGDITCYVDFRRDEDLLPNEEMQGVVCYKNEFYFSTTYGLYKLL